MVRTLKPGRHDNSYYRDSNYSIHSRDNYYNELSSFELNSNYRTIIGGYDSNYHPVNTYYHILLLCHTFTDVVIEIYFAISSFITNLLYYCVDKALFCIVVKTIQLM